jgi:hypothetical protein
MELILNLPHLGDVTGRRYDKLRLFVPLRNENEQYVNRPSHTGHSPPSDVALVLTGTDAGPHMPEWQLSRLDAQHLFDPPPEYLIALQAVAPFGGGIEVFVDERTFWGRAEQRQPIR